MSGLELGGSRPDVPVVRPEGAVQWLRRLLVAGFAAAHVAGLLAIVAFLFFGGVRAGISAAAAFAAVILFFTIGHAVLMRHANDDPRRVLWVELGSYALRVSLFGLLLAVYLRLDADRRLDSLAVVVTALVCVLAWLAAEVWQFGRLRITNFDLPTDEVDSQ